MRVLTLLSLLAMGCSTVTPGTVTVRAHVCGDHGPDDRYTVIRSGRYWAGHCREHFTLPTREQRAVWTKDPHEGSPNDESITFAAVDGQSVNIDVGVSYQLGHEDDDILKMINTYGPDLDKTIDSRVRDAVRHALNICAADNNYTVQDIYGSHKTELMGCAETAVQEEFNPNGLYVARLTLNSEVRLPAQIRDAMERSQKATQDADRARREVEQAKAEGEKKVASATAEAEALRIRSESEAQANRTMAKSLTPEIIELRRLEVQMEMAKKWDGKLPQTMMGDEVPMLMMKPGK